MNDRRQSLPGGPPAGAFSTDGPVRSRGRRLQLNADRAAAVRFLSDANIRLAEDATRSWVTLTRTGVFTDPRYGEFAITPRMLDQMVANFEADAFGQDVLIDIEHTRDHGAAGRVLELRVEGKRLRANVEWSPMGAKAIRERGYRYMSAEFHEDFVDNETQQPYGAVLMGAALTIRPAIKRLDPVELSETSLAPGARAHLIHPELVRTLSESTERTMKKFLENLRKQLAAMGLAQGVVKQLCDAYESAAKNLGEDETALKALAGQFEGTGKSLSESIGERSIELSINLPKAAPGTAADNGDYAGMALSAAEVDARVEKALAAAKKQDADTAAANAKALSERRDAFTGAINAADGLDDETKRELSAQAPELVTGDMPIEQCKKLAEVLIKGANETAAARKLAGLGYGDSRSGSPSVTPGDSPDGKKLSEQVSQMLARTSVAQAGQIRPDLKPTPMAQRVLAEFDRRNAQRIHHEVKALAGETSLDGNADIPVAFQRQVILETLSDLNVLALLNQLTDFNASTTVEIPYEERNGSSITNDGIVYEGAGIPNAGVTQKMDLAYVTAMKLAMNVTNELMHFSVASGINWDAWARNLASNTRFMRELLQKRVANNLQRAADAYNAVAVTGESIAAQLDGSTSTIKTVNFPIVRPFQQRDIAGNAIGSVENAIAIDFDGTPVTEFDGTGTQSAGTYYRVTDFNLGYVQFVDEAGDPVTPNETTATIGYSRATNVVLFDTDFDAAETTLEKHYNGLVRAIGGRKAELSGHRQVMVDFALMSPGLADDITNAEIFASGRRRDGSDTDPVTGALERVKGLPMFETNAPNLDMGDSRILIGQRGVGAYAISKPWSVGTPFEAVNGTGQPTGRKVAYGEEYNAVHVPISTRDRFTSVIVYSATSR